MHDDHIFKLFVAALVAVGFGVVALVRGIGAMREEMLVADIPLSQIAALALGRVAVTGKATAQFIAEAPFSGLPCLLSRSAIWVREGRNMRHVTTLEVPPQPTFSVTDDTGSVTVVADDAKIDVERLVMDPVDPNGSAESDAMFTAWGLDPTLQHIKVIEERLPPDSGVYIQGMAVDGASVGNGAHIERAVPLPAGRPVIIAHPFAPLLVALGDRSGFQNELSWRAAAFMGGGGALILGGMAAVLWMGIAAITMADPRTGAALSSGNIRPLIAKMQQKNPDHRDATGHTRLMRAAQAGETLPITSLLDEGSNVNAVDSHGRTALDYAVLAKSQPTVRIILAAKPFLLTQDDRGNTALHLAAERGDASIVRDLLNAGADPSVVNAHSQTPLALAQASKEPGSRESALLIAHALGIHLK
ncbi:MAG TPA: ankyrin repeat domain-containing protein [Candidatus Baltobacteraceae bacterium]|nr:ankyrin repeat domain-containing protein [Candidatus Baltobacteraceae bacterium]